MLQQLSPQRLITSPLYMNPLLRTNANEYGGSNVNAESKAYVSALCSAGFFFHRPVLCKVLLLCFFEQGFG